MRYYSDEELEQIKKDYILTGNIYKIPEDDKAVYDLFSSGKSKFTFQFNSDFIRKFCKEYKPESVYDLAVVTAIGRPGPMQYMKSIIDRKWGREPIEGIKLFEPYLKNTYNYLCFPINTKLIDYDTGKIVIGKDIKEGMRIASKADDGKVCPNTISKIFFTGKKKIVKITLSNNNFLRLSEDHEVLTLNGYKKAKDLIPKKDRLCRINEPSSQGKERIDKDEAWFVGTMIGDGSIFVDERECCCLTNVDEEVIENATKFAKTLYNVEPVFSKGKYLHFRTKSDYKNNRGQYDRKDSRKFSEKNGVNNLMKKYGFKNRVLMYDKYIPEKIFLSDRESKLNFLAGLIDTDGCVQKKKYLSFKTTSEKLFEDTKLLLDSLGFLYGEFSKPYKNNKRKDRKSMSWGLDNKSSFIVSKYLRLKRKQVEFDESTKRKDEVVDWNLLKRHLNVSSKNECRKILNKKFNENRGDPRYFYDLFEKETGSTLKYVLVKKVEYDGEEECMDITVDNVHNFSIKSYIVKNCFQEQFMLMAKNVAGFSGADADNARKALAKKNLIIMADIKPKFFEGCLKHAETQKEKEDLTKQLEKFWDELQAFASYSFNFSHAYAYAKLGYVTGYFLVHYGPEYMAGVLNKFSGDKDKVRDAIYFCEERGIKVLPPNVLHSRSAFTSTAEGNIVYGLGAIKGLGKASEEIIKGVKENKPKTLEDFVLLDEVKPGKLESLIKAGALDGFGIKRSLLIESIDEIKDFKKKESKLKLKKNQQSLFDFSPEKIKIKEKSEISVLEVLLMEKKYLGDTVSFNLVDLVDRNKKWLEEVGSFEERTSVGKTIKNVAGIITKAKTIYTKNGSQMMFLEIDCKEKEIEVVVFENEIKNLSKKIDKDNIVLLDLSVSKPRENDEWFTFIAKNIKVIN